jgi:phosphoribosylaminoimidazolecarboxamide formyltransferase/IMP cyclohydrolase
MPIKKNPEDSPPSQKVTKTTEKYALLSVWDKNGIVEFAKEISKMGFQIISSGGTAKVLSETKVKVIPIQEVTGNPESFDG